MNFALHKRVRRVRTFRGEARRLVIVDAGPAAVERFLEFFSAAIANGRTRAAYERAAGQFLAWCASRGLTLRAIAPLHCHTLRATGITAYLSNGGTLEHAQRIAGHASPKTTKLYDRTADTISLYEIERIVI